MMKNLSEKSFAMIIAIEDYRFSDKNNGILSVKYAKNDAIKFQRLLKEEFCIPDENIILWIDREATKSAFENELKYRIKQLTKEDRFYFYYAGHGFYQNGNNRLTCWDTHPNSLIETTVSIKDILIDLLEESECEQSLMFLDCCSTALKENITSRDLITNFSINDLEFFLTSSNKYMAVFMSCSPGEKSYPHEVLKNGIWTWHLVEALKGNAPEAIINEVFITDNSLRNHLSNIVPKFITEQTQYKNTQKPYTKIYASNDFIIRKLDKTKFESNDELPQLQIDYSSLLFRKIEYKKISKAAGFKSSHYVPDVISTWTKSFVQSVFEQDVINDVQSVYEKTKRILSLRKRQIDYGARAGNGYVDNEFFRYKILLNQYSDDPNYAEIVRIWEIRKSRNLLPTDFDNIFLFNLNEVNLSFIHDVDFGILVEQFENLQKNKGGELNDNEIKGEIDYQTNSGISLLVNTKKNIIEIKPKRNMKSLEFIDLCIEELGLISKNQVLILN